MESRSGEFDESDDFIHTTRHDRYREFYEDLAPKAHSENEGTVAEAEVCSPGNMTIAHDHDTDCTERRKGTYVNTSEASECDGKCWRLVRGRMAKGK